MSLLIKALDKAEKAQEEQQLKLQKETRRRAENIANDSESGLHLELEPPQQPSKSEGLADFVEDSDDIARAANIFEAKQYTNTGINPLLWIAGIGFLVLICVGYYFYVQLNNLQLQPAVINQPVEKVSNYQSPSSQAYDVEQNKTEVESGSDHSDSLLKPSVSGASSEEPNEDNTKIGLAANEEKVFEGETPKQKTVADSQKVVNQSGAAMTFGAPIASESASIEISRSQTEQGVNPVLLNAYNAYNAGNDTEALALYRTVLQKDRRNVDALLGMGAIAERQGRQNDALGWFRKVLELEPRNAIALSAFYDSEQDVQTKEQKLKSLIAKNPNDFNALADLGAYYADQDRWAEAQQSYFEAYRLNITADNAFNLAVSLDQMRKPKLALPYYQQALDLINKSPTYSFDQSIVQMRIKAIQEK